jgi:hypothetical protein
MWHPEETESNTTLVQSESKAASVQNPMLVFEHVYREIDHLFEALYRRYDATFDDLADFLRHREPNVLDRIQTFESQIDSDVYGTFRDGRLSDTQFRHWKQRLEMWASTLRSALRLFEVSQYGEEMVTLDLYN